jgi:peptide deformylase
MALQLLTNYRQPQYGILQEPDERLRKVSTSVEVINETTKNIIEKLIDTLKRIDKPHSLWLGMSAPQIGYTKRIIVIKNGFQKYLVMINPEIVKQKWIFPSVSGCYSLKGFYLIKSPYWSKVTYLDMKGKSNTQVFKGGKAVLIKQEIDHLNGKLVCD